MEDFKKKLLRQQIALIAGGFIACSTYVFSRFFVGEAQFPENLYHFILGYQTGLFAFICCTLAFYIARNSAALINPGHLKNLHISETDERKLFIRQKVGSTGMNIIVYGLIIGAIVSGSINYVVFLTLLGASIFVAVVFGVLKLYYRSKF